MVESTKGISFRGPVNAVCFLSKTLLAVGEGFTLKLYDLKTNELLKSATPFTQKQFKITGISLQD